ncbi:MAG: protein kinase [Verrucomicrobia bacterium]|nr:protein kinase [Verrucomicrobiota bacterium]
MEAFRKTCPSCTTSLPEGEIDLNYCPCCGVFLKLANAQHESIAPAPLPPEELPQHIGPYTILRPIARGGMGEVYLAYDPLCRRKVALKRIRTDLKNRELLYKRFLREAHLTSQLTHPGIVPIYTIHHEGEELYYTMPFVEGRTLKQILKDSRRQQESEQGSIKSLVPVFMGVCQAVAYAHHRGVIHRDLKPENIMVGAYGEVYILDWGLAKQFQETEEEGAIEELQQGDLTAIGKIFGTVAYMAPERALGHPASTLSDIYSLGVILYEILTLNLPFQRENIKTFRKQLQGERLINPAKVAPYRNVPRQLARMAQRALRPRMTERYGQVEEMIHELEGYLQGRSDWFQIATVDLNNRDDWEFQEAVYLTEDLFLTGSEAGGGWVSMALSRESFPGNIRLFIRVVIKEEGEGVGFMVKVPEASQREHLNNGYFLFLGSDKRPGVHLHRSAVQVAGLPHLFLARGKPHDIEIEEVDGALRVTVDGELVCSHVSYLPLAGTHIGIFSADDAFVIEEFRVYVGSYSIKVDCLAIPDAFLAAGDYRHALSEYRRIAYSFPERDEGREAQFRAGITLLEQAKKDHLSETYDLALEEFAKLANTPGAPLEYLGKSLVYRAQGEMEEEAKCFDLAFRKYRHHPLLPLLEEQLIYLLHASSRTDRQAAYRFLLIIAQHLPKIWEDPDIQRIIEGLEQNWEHLPFFSPSLERSHVAAQLAFWLARPLTLLELKDACPDASFALIELGALDLVTPLDPIIALAHQENVLSALKALPKTAETRLLVYLSDLALKNGERGVVPLLLERAPLSGALKIRDIWADLLEDRWQQAGEKLHTFPLDKLQHETSLIHTLFGCWLANTEGEEIAGVHFEGVLDRPYPPSWSLLSHYLSGKISLEGQWGKGAFLWEKRQLFRPLHLSYHCLGEEKRALEFAALEKEQYIH